MSSDDELVARLRSECNCNIDTSPCGAEEECRLAMEAADRIEALTNLLYGAPGNSGRAFAVSAIERQARAQAFREAADDIESLLPPRVGDPQDATDRLIDETRRADVRALRALAEQAEKGQ